jgi:hypothetical protein
MWSPFGDCGEVASRRMLRLMSESICQVPVTADQIMFAPDSWCSDSS